MIQHKTRAVVVVERLELRTFRDGTVDFPWGDYGVVSPGFSSSGVQNLEVAPGGKVVAFGHASGSYAAYVYGASGGQEISASISTGLSAVQPDGRYITAGDGGIRQFAANGTLIRTFSGGNLSPVPLGKEQRYRDLAVAANGDVVVSGAIGTGLFDPEGTVDWYGFEVYSAEGQLKWSVKNPLGHNVALLPDGRVIAAFDGRVACYRPDGQLDPTFGTAGIAGVAGSPAVIKDVVLDRWGRIYVWWSVGNDDTTAHHSVTRLRPSGARDKSFGSNGNVNATALNLGGALGTFGGHAITVSPDGQVYAATMINVNGDHRVAVGRFTDAGQKDLAWGASGVAVGDITAGDKAGGQVRDLVVLPDGGVIVGAMNGPSNSGGSAKLVRFTGAGSDGGGTPVTQPVVTLANNRLTVTGTSGDDVIVLQTTADMGINVTVNGTVHSYMELEVRSISIAGGDGKDYIEARDLANLPPVVGTDFPVTLDGGNGNDVIVGSQGRDRITGGNDDDKLHGWSGNDWVSGNAQKDRVNGGAGDDTVSGNGGRDFLVGEAGDDTLLGGDQPDTLLGMEGDDSLSGEGSHDRLDGGAGEDFLSGAGGNDTFIARDNFIDHLVGGIAATDIALVDDDDVLVGIEQLLA